MKRLKTYMTSQWLAPFYAVLAVVISGCAVTKPPDFMAQRFETASVSKVAVLPVLDSRIDRSKRLKLNAWVLPIVEHALKRKGYAYSVYRDRALISHIDSDALEARTADFIATVGPPSARWILLFVLEDSSSKLTFGSTGSAEMSAYLFDKRNRKLCWRDKEVTQVGQGGLIGMLMKGSMEESAIQQAAINILSTLPRRGERLVSQQK